MGREADPEAEADPQLLYGHGLPVLPYHHTAVEIKEHCVEHTAKHCVDKPVTRRSRRKCPTASSSTEPIAWTRSTRCPRQPVPRHEVVEERLSKLLFSCVKMFRK